MSGGTWNYQNNCLYDIAGDLKSKAKDADSYSEKTRLNLKELGEKCDIIAKLLHEADYMLAGDTDEDDFNEACWTELEKYRFIENAERGVCPVCGHVFFKTNTSQTYCSDKCKRRYQNKKYYENIKKHIDKKKKK